MATLRAVAGLVFFLLPLGIARAHAEGRLRFDHLTVDDGLSHNWVMAIHKDSYGFVWIGTQDGLNRYDGSGFVTYRPEPENPRSLPSTNCGVIFEDSRRRLWVGSSWAGAGVALLDRAHESFTQFLPAPGQPTGNVVRSIAEDRTGLLWLGTDNGLASLDPSSGQVQRYPIGPETERRGDVPDTTVLSVLEDRRGTLWVGTQRGLLQFDRGRHAYERWSGARIDPASLSGAPIWDIREDEDGALWVGTMGAGLHRLDPASGRGTAYLPDSGAPDSISSARIARAVPDGRGKVWVGTENGGLNVLDVRTRRFAHYSPDPDEETSINSASIWDLQVDDQGIVWIGTFNGGVNVVSPLGQRFRLLRAGRGKLSDPHVSAVLKDHAGNLWVGTDGGGLNRIDAGSGSLRYFRHGPSASTIGSDSVLALLEDSRHRLWIGGWDGGLGLLDPASGRVTRFRHDPKDPSSLVSDHVRRILELRTGELLVVTQAGPDLFDRETRRFTRLAARYKEATLDGAYYSAAEGPDGNLWLVGSVSALSLDRKTGSCRRYRHDPSDPASIGSGEIPAVLIDRAGNVWFATDGGLSCLPAGVERMRRYTAADGLPSNGVTNVLEDASGNLWITTNRGLTLFEAAVRLPEKPSLLNFDIHDGLQGYQFIRGASFRSADGEMFFGGVRGLNAFHPTAIQRNTTPPPVVLTALRLFNRPQTVGAKGSPLTRALSETAAIRLSYEQSMITVDFAALNYLLPQKNRYSYKLEPLDRDWSPASTQHSATYARLPPGEYTFYVRAANNDGVWNQEGVALRIRVTPPFWATWWFRGLVLVALGSGLYYSYRVKMQATEERRRELALTVEARTADLQQEIAQHRLTEERLHAQAAERERAEREIAQIAEQLKASNRELESENDQRRRAVEEARQAERAAVRERDLLHALMDNIPDLIYFKDRDGRFVRINKAHAAALGLASPDGAAGKGDVDFHGAEFARRTREDERRLIASGRPLLNQLEHDTKADRWYLATKVPLADETGTVNGLVGISKDITDRKRSEEKLERDLQAFLEVVEAVAHGDLTRRGQDAPETLGRIACAVNGMLEGFASILTGVRDAAFSVSSSASQILASATQIAKGAQYGSEQVQSTSAAAGEMAVSMAEVLRHAEQSAEAAQQVLDHVKMSEASVGATADGMGRIDAAVAATAEKMHLLEARSKQIFEIIDLLEDIAAQSTLLSLNAAIEAAHAGDAGRGFGVVAEEIRRLADRSRESTKAVTAIVEGIVEETRLVLDALEHGVREVEGGRELSRRAQQSLERIKELVERSAGLAGHISNASREQARATQTVSTALHGIATVTEQALVGANETSAAVRGLVGLAEELKRAITRFHVG
jgi:PAS domain S-box-containing protein